MGNAVVHFEICGPDDARLGAFYRELFGWRITAVPGYTLIDTCAGSGINGGISASHDGQAWCTFYVEAADLQPILDKANLLGARTVTPITDVPGMVTFAMLADPDGLLIGLVQAAAVSHEQAAALAPSEGSGAPVDWFEVLGTDADATQRFYAELFGWQVNVTGMPGYRLVDTGAGKGAAGGLGAHSTAGWATVYASVPDVDAVLARAVQLGGDRVYGPAAVDDHMQTGALRDPAGNVFGVYHHGEHAAEHS
jgi:uncharacterized protein